MEINITRNRNGMFVTDFIDQMEFINVYECEKTIYAIMKDDGVTDYTIIVW